ncbi:MAG TPA: AAA family ATPase [Solirubrobacteraceae bacterium]|nr:AAA family ATPase [Solirubrobacteraceae bacterium]
MHISSIVVVNFRNFKFLEIRNLSGAAVIVGENGVGKTNLVAALRLVLDPSLPDTARELDAEDFWDGLERPFHGEVIQIVVELAGFDDDDRAKGVLGDAIVDDDPVTARLTYAFRPRDTLREGHEPVSPKDYEAVTYVGLDDDPTPFGADVRRWISLQSLPALRDAESDLRSWSRSPVSRLLDDLGLAPERLEQIADKSREASRELLEEESVVDLQDALNERLQDMVGEVFAVELSLDVGATRADQVLRAIQVQIDNRRDITRTSLGSANLLYLALLLERLARRRRNNDLVSRLLAIEEPEAHLHPHVQRVLFRHLVATEPELLLTTHSAHVASVSPLRSLVLLRNTGADGTVALRPPVDELSERQTRDLERYLDVTRAEMLFARGVILVEGAAELYLVPAFAAELGHDLDALGVSVCSVHGVDFKPYRMLLGSGGLEIPHVVITDGDADRDRRGREHAGVKRGRLLLTGDDREAVADAIAGEDFQTARELLAAHGVHVGVYTIEVDLVDGAADAMRTTYRELGASSVSRAKFRAELEDIGSGPEGRKALVRRIEGRGKGRFAQRLAEHLGAAAPPAYIKDAIESLVDQLVG